MVPSDSIYSGRMYPKDSLWKDIRRPGLTPAAFEIDRLSAELPKRWAVYRYKLSRSLLWVLFIGGTGTGKSTLFNALCGAPLSETGVERPKTCGPLVYAHRQVALEQDFPFPQMDIGRFPPEDASSSPHAGDPERLLVLEHRREDLAHAAIVDTPDLDSLEMRNRRMVENLYLLADVVVFVTSQEKYADDVPFQFLLRIRQEEKPCFFIFNKAEAMLDREEVKGALRSQGITMPEDRLWILPFLPSEPSELLPAQKSFKSLSKAFFKMSAQGEASRLLKTERQRSARELASQTGRLIDLLEKESEAAGKWLDHLDFFFKTVRGNLFEQQEEHLGAETRQYLEQEIRRLYGKYDLLGKPRRFIARIFLTPLRMLGLDAGKPQESPQEALARLRSKIDLNPVRAAVESFNRSVLEKLSPADETSVLYKRLREPTIALTGEEIRKQVMEEQERLGQWLESTFQNLAQGIPKSKELGIYSISILWGGLILSLETLIGGGFHILEAVLDAAIAPFVTRGTVELFAYQEIRKIGHELGERYKNGLASVIEKQRDRYAECLRSVMISPEALAALKATQHLLRDDL